MLSLSHDSQNVEAEPGFNMIECQNDLANMHIGLTSVQAAGCEVIATYNVIKSLSENKKMWDGVGKITGWLPLSYLISQYEKDGIVLSGKFGVAPLAIVDMLRRLGYNTDVYIPGKRRLFGRKKPFDISDFFDRSRALIMTFYNDGEDLMKQIHTVAVTKKDNTYTAHNVYGNGYVHGPFDSMDDLVSSIGSGRAKPIIYISIL